MLTKKEKRPVVDDIVQELRDWAYIADEAAGKVNFVMLNGSVFSSAADEIEHLRSSAALCPECAKGDEIAIYCGDEVVIIDGELASTTIHNAVSEYVIKAIKELIERENK